MTVISKNDIIEATVSGYSSDGMGVVKYDGNVIFVRGALNGEQCKIRILKVGKSVSYGKIEEIVLPSPHRIKPKCSSFLKCGGCTLLHMDYAEELSYKKQLVEDALSHIGGCTVPVSEIFGSPETENSRNKVIYNIQLDKSTQKIKYGFFRPRSHDVVEADSCVIGFREADMLCKTVVAWMEKNNIAPYDIPTKNGTIRHVFLRKGYHSSDIQVGIVSNVKKLPKLDELRDMLLASCEKITSIVLNFNNSVGNTVLGGEFTTVYGKDYISDSLCGLSFDLSMRSFFQVNPAQAEHLYDKAIEYASLTGCETALDLYCGTGTITLCLAKKAKKVYGTEIIAAAIENAKENAKKNGIDNAEFFCADASETAKSFAIMGMSPDIISVDPPRRGLSPEVVESIIKMSPKRVVYVSCDPGTLARDIKLFAGGGYAVQKVTCYDMFPRCSHVETVCLMSIK